MGRKRDDWGQYVETVSPETVLEVSAVVEGPAATSSDVAEHLECSTEAARQKLRDLVEDGILARRKTGRTALYWRTGDDESESPDKTGRSVDTTVAIRDDAVETQETPPTEERHLEEKVREETSPDPDFKMVVGDVLGNKVNVTRRRAVEACIEYLHEEETVKKSNFLDTVFDEYSAGYASPEAWWNDIGSEYLRAVADEYTPVSAPPRDGSQIWQWRGES